MKNENFYVIHGWMVRKLNLSNTDLLVFAVIYGFTAKSKNGFIGTISYLSSWCNCTEETIDFVLKSLMRRKLIRKSKVKKDGKDYDCYKTVLPKYLLNCI